MRRRLPARLSKVSLAITLALLAVMFPLSLGEEPLFDTVLYGLLALSFGVMGALIVRRQPENRLGWLFCWEGVWGSLVEVWEAFAYHSLPTAIAGEWLVSWSWVLDITVFGLIFLLFPTGRPLNRGWARVTWLFALGGALAIPGQALSVANPSDFQGGTNPLGVDHPAVSLASIVGDSILVFAIGAAVVSVFVRYRRANGIERLQLRQFAFAGTLVTLSTAAAIPFYYESVVVQAAVGAAFVTMPLAVGLAILRYRLYDIDILINRALVYGSLTAMTVSSYAALVVGLGWAARAVTGQEGNEVVVAATTLIVAALFQPARRRIQGIVDRRFYRSRYDAARTLEAFQLRLRDELDLESLRVELAATVHSTLQPAGIGVWVREGRAP